MLVSSEAPQYDKDVPMDRPQMTITGPVLDAADPVGLARFYERLLGWAMIECEGPRPGFPSLDGWAKLRSPDGDMKIEFQWEQYYSPPIWPPTEGGHQTMMHLDIAVDLLEVGVAWAVEAGATIATYQPQDGVSVMLDPEGHPFCLFSSC